MVFPSVGSTHHVMVHPCMTSVPWQLGMSFAQTISVDLHTLVVAYIWCNTEDIRADHRDLLRIFFPKVAELCTIFTLVNMYPPATLPNFPNFVYQSASGLSSPWHVKHMPMTRRQT